MGRDIGALSIPEAALLTVYTYDTKTGAYSKDGVQISLDDLRELMRAQAAVEAENSRKDAEDVLDGTILLLLFLALMARRVKLQALSFWLIAIGGWDEDSMSLDEKTGDIKITAEDGTETILSTTQVEAAVASEYEYLEKFWQAANAGAAAGTVLTNDGSTIAPVIEAPEDVQPITSGQFAARAAAYGKGALKGFENGLADLARQVGAFDEEMRILGTNENHCEDCPTYAGYWMPLNSLPDIGSECACGSLCHCVFTFRLAEAAQDVAA